MAEIYLHLKEIWFYNVGNELFKLCRHYLEYSVINNTSKLSGF